MVTGSQQFSPFSAQQAKVPVKNVAAAKAEEERMAELMDREFHY